MARPMDGVVCFSSIAGWRARGRRRDGSEAGGLAAASARRGMAEVEMGAEKVAEGAQGGAGFMFVFRDRGA